MSERAPLGQVDLFVPADLFELTTPDDPAEARRQFDALIGQMFGRMGDARRATLVDGIMAWRQRLDEVGVVMHAIAAVPPSDEHTAAHWHFFAGVVDTVPLGEIDAGEVMRRYLHTKPSTEHLYTESYPTAMGWGLGIITRDVLHLDELPVGAAHVPPDVPVGIAVGLSGSPTGKLALLVVGLCLDTERTLEMASIVAVIAGESIVKPATADA
jgi:hypothetical protein